MKFQSVCIVGAGRVGKAMAARLADRLPTRTAGRDLDVGESDLVVLCVPDGAIAEVAAALPVGPWIAHTSGATGLAALDPHERRFSLHPLQTFTAELGPEQFDGAWAAITAQTDAGLAAARDLAGLLALQPFELDDEDRPVYHAAAAFASSFLVTVHEVASELMEAASAPPEALEPLMRRTMDNDFRHTGPLVRGDWKTIERHRQVLRERRPQLLPLYEALTEATATLLKVR